LHYCESYNNLGVDVTCQLIQVKKINLLQVVRHKSRKSFIASWFCL